MEADKLASCPFCGKRPDSTGEDTLYPTGRWREDDGMRHYISHQDKREEHGRVWTMHCPTPYGGCGAEVSADSRDEAIAAWNRRPVAPTSAEVPPLPGPLTAIPFHGDLFSADQMNARYQEGYAAGLAADRPWLPIDDAPRNGTPVLLLRAGERFVAAWVHGDHPGWCTPDGYKIFRATHFQPLPERPQ